MKGVFGGFGAVTKLRDLGNGPKVGGEGSQTGGK